MNEFMLLSTLIFVALVSCLWLIGPLRKAAAWMSILVPVLPLIWALTSTGYMVDIPWLLMGARFGLDTTGRVFLGVTAALWLAAGVFGHSYLQRDSAKQRFKLFFFLTMVGNLGVTIAHDVVSFLLFYTLMSVAAYGLIVHDGSASSRGAGRVYIALTILGEMILFVAIALAFHESQSLVFEDLKLGIATSPYRSIISVFILCGFGIKLGVMPLHFWLPLAHPAAPTPASAVLSGAMIKTGLLGMLRVLPFGIVALDTVAPVFIITGVATAFLAAAIGVMQSNPKTVLAYSSISQMGLLAIGAGIGLLVPDAWKIVSAMLLLFIAHHAVAKAALFLGVGIAGATKGGGWKRFGVIGGLIWAALTLSGLPFTTGLAAKTALKYTVAEAPESWATILISILPFSSIATSLLMARYLWLVWPSVDTTRSYPRVGMVIPWGLLTAGATVNWLLCLALGLTKSSWLSLSAPAILGALWPILVAGILATIAIYLSKSGRRSLPIGIPAGDIVIPIFKVLVVLQTILGATIASITLRGVEETATRLRIQSGERFKGAVAGFSRIIEGDGMAGPLICLLSILLFVMIISS